MVAAGMGTETGGTETGGTETGETETGGTDAEGTDSAASIGLAGLSDIKFAPQRLGSTILGLA